MPKRALTSGESLKEVIRRLRPLGRRFYLALYESAKGIGWLAPTPYRSHDKTHVLIAPGSVVIALETHLSGLTNKKSRFYGVTIAKHGFWVKGGEGCREWGYGR